MNKWFKKRVRRDLENCVRLAGGKSPDFDLEEDAVFFDFIAKGEAITRSAEVCYLHEFGIYTVRTYLLTDPVEKGETEKAAIIYAINVRNNNAHLEVDDNGDVFAEYYFLEEERTRFFAADFTHFTSFVSVCEDNLNGNFFKDNEA